MIGAGAEVTRLANSSPIRMIKGEVGKPDPLFQSERELYNSLKKESPIATGLGEALPYMAVPFGTFSKPVGSAVSKVTSSTLGKNVSRNLFDKGSKLMKREPYNPLYNATGDVMKNIGAGVQKLPRKLKNSAVLDSALFGGAASLNDSDTSVLEGAGSAATGSLAFKAAGRLLSKAPDQLRKFDRSTVDWVKRNKIKTFPGLRQGDPTLQKVDSALRSRHGTDKIFTTLDNENAVKVNRIFGKAIGEASDSMDPEYMARNYARIGRRMDELAEGTSPRLMKDTHDRLKSLSNEFYDVYKYQSPAIKEYADEIIRLSDQGLDAHMSGEQYQRVTKNLNKFISNSVRKGEPEGEFAIKIKDILDDMVEDGIGKDKLKGWKTARRKYRMLKMAQDNIEAGDIKPGKLFNYLNKKDPNAFVGGKRGHVPDYMKDIYKIADYGDLLRRQNGTSLGISEALGMALKNPSMGSRGLGNMLLNPLSKEVGPLNNAMIGLYRRGGDTSLRLPNSINMPKGKFRGRPISGASNKLSIDRLFTTVGGRYGMSGVGDKDK